MSDWKLTPNVTVEQIEGVLSTEGYDTKAIRPEKVKEYYDKGRLYWSSHEIVLVTETDEILAVYNPAQRLHAVPKREANEFEKKQKTANQNQYTN